MNKPVDTLRTFLLYILASQANNPFKFSQTTVEISVVRRNDHEPRFEKNAYFGTVSVDLPISSLVMDAEISSRPLRIFAADEDFPDKVNPDVTYQIQNSTDFTVSQDGFVLTTVTLDSAATITLLAIANDKATMEEASTLIRIDVTPLASTTPVPTTMSTATATPNAPETRTTISKPSDSSVTTGINDTLSTAPSGSSTVPPASTTSNPGLTGSPGTNTTSGSGLPPLVTTTTSPFTTGSTSQSHSTRSPITGVSQASRTSNAGVTVRPATESGSIPPPLVITTTSSYVTVNTSQSQQATGSPLPGTSHATTDTQTTTSSQAGSTKSPVTITNVLSPSTARITSRPGSTRPLTTTSGTFQSTDSSATVETRRSTSLISKSTTRSVTTAATVSSAPSLSSTATSSTSNSSSVSSPEAESDCEKNMIILGATLGSLLAITLVLLLGIIYKYYKSSRNQENGDIDQFSVDSTYDDDPDSGANDYQPLASDESASSDPVPKVRKGTPPPSRKAMESSQEPSQFSVDSTNDDDPDSGADVNKPLASDESASSDPVPKVRKGTPPPLRKAMESSQASSDSGEIKEGEEEESSKDSEKEVKSILTKDRRPVDDGYKAVWFKEDINPEAKDDVMMIEVDSDAEQNRNDDDGEDRDDEGEGDTTDSGRGDSSVSVAPGIPSTDDPNDHSFLTAC